MMKRIIGNLTPEQIRNAKQAMQAAQEKQQSRLGLKHAPTMEIYVKVDTVFWYDSQGGQSISFTVPAGTKFRVPATLVYGSHD